MEIATPRKHHPRKHRSSHGLEISSPVCHVEAETTEVLR